MPQPALVPDQYVAPSVRPLVTAALVLGVGLAAVLDAAVFHQLLQWHHFADAATDEGAARLRVDGAFLLGAFLVTLVGVALLWRASARVRAPTGGRALASGMVLGGAMFNAVEVLVDHFLLGLHRLHPSGHEGWDVGFVAINLLVAAGAAWWLGRDGLVRLARAERRHRQKLGG